MDVTNSIVVLKRKLMDVGNVLNFLVIEICIVPLIAPKLEHLLDVSEKMD
jgi:hypothetical protein